MSQAQASGNPADGEKTAEVEKKRIGVFNLPAGITNKDELRELAKPFGSVTDVEFFGPRGNKLAFGFVTFKSSTDAQYAVYRLHDGDFGGKLPVKAMLREQQERKTGAPGPQKKRSKKPMTSLVTLTPKNLPTPPPAEATDSPKKSWDLPAPGAQHPKGPRNPKKFPSDQNGQGANTQNQNPRPNTQKGKQPVPTQGQNNVLAPAPQNNQAPVSQNNQAAAQPKGPAKKAKNPKNSSNQNQGQNQAIVAPHQNQPAPAQNQANNQGQAHQNPPASNASAVPANPAAKTKKRGQKPQNRNFAFTVNVVDPKTGLTLHVLQLSQESYDKNILPLVTKH